MSTCPFPVSVQGGWSPQVRRSFPLYLFTPASICLLAERNPRFHYCLGGGPSPRAIENTLASPAFPKGSPCCCPCAFPDWSLVHWPFAGRPALSCRIRYNETLVALPLVHWSSPKTCFTRRRFLPREHIPWSMDTRQPSLIYTSCTKWSEPASAGGLVIALIRHHPQTFAYLRGKFPNHARFHVALSFPQREVVFLRTGANAGLYERRNRYRLSVCTPPPQTWVFDREGRLSKNG